MGQSVGVEENVALENLLSVVDMSLVTVLNVQGSNVLRGVRELPSILEAQGRLLWGG